MTTSPAIHDDSSRTGDINLTPMLDVVFILLIFFVVTATFIREVGMPIGLSPAYSTPVELESITVSVGPDSSFTVNGRVMSGASVAPYVRQLHAEFPDAGFGVVVEPGSKVKDTARAVDAGRQAGFGVVPISSVP